VTNRFRDMDSEKDEDKVVNDHKNESTGKEDKEEAGPSTSTRPYEDAEATDEEGNWQVARRRKAPSKR